MANEKFREVVEEFRNVVMGRAKLIDAIAPPLIFLILNALFNLSYAIGGALAVALLIGVVRLIRGQPLQYALGGLGGALLAALAAAILGRAEGYFIPNLLTGGISILLCLISVLIQRPLVAWTSHLARGWPLAWYWHPKVRPAYSEVTLAWAGFFALRLALQIALLQNESGDLAAVGNIMLGWPTTIVLLIISYLYGTWRLRHLHGPSVEEFKEGAAPPWQGQRRGF